MQTRRTTFGIGTPHGDATGGKPGRTSWFETWRISMRRWLSSRASDESADVDEVAQEVFLRLLRYSDDVLAECPQDHLFRIATGVMNEWHERLGGREHTLINAEVRAAVGRLPSRQREALLLHINEELTYRQVAVRMKVAPRVVRRDIVTAYANLRDELRSAKLDGISTE